MIFSDTNIIGMLTTTGKSTRKPPYFIINKRLVKFKTLSKALKRLFQGSFPHGAICISLKPNSVDVNVEVDKSAVICQDEAKLVSIIENVITDQVLVSKPLPAVLHLSQDFYERNLASQNTNIKELVQPNSDVLGFQKSLSDDLGNISADKCIMNMKNTTSSDCLHVVSVIKDQVADSNDNKGMSIDSNTTCIPHLTNSQQVSNEEREESVMSVINENIPTDSVSLIENGNIIPYLHVEENVDLSLLDEIDNDLQLNTDDVFSPRKEGNHSDSHKYDNILVHQNNKSDFDAQFREHHKLSNIIDEVENKSKKKQASLVSWSSSQGTKDFKFEFTSPEKFQQNNKIVSNKKRSKSISPNSGDKKRKISINSPISIHSKISRKAMNFNLYHIKSCLLFHQSKPQKCLNSRAFKIDDKWLVLSRNKLFSFNPSRAQEVNVYRKMMTSQSLKYGPVSETDNWDITPSDTTHDIMTMLSSLPTSVDTMGEATYVTEKCLAINGIRIRKMSDSLFRVVNICEGVVDFKQTDVLEILYLILNYRTLDQDLKHDLSVCEYSNVRGSKICDSMKERAAKLSQSFAAFQPTSTDVIDLFLNTNETNKCVHNNSLKELLWDFD